MIIDDYKLAPITAVKTQIPGICLYLCFFQPVQTLWCILQETDYQRNIKKVINLTYV
jgi:hypothetical protein